MSSVAIGSRSGWTSHGPFEGAEALEIDQRVGHLTAGKPLGFHRRLLGNAVAVIAVQQGDERDQDKAVVVVILFESRAAAGVFFGSISAPSFGVQSGELRF